MAKLVALPNEEVRESSAREFLEYLTETSTAPYYFHLWRLGRKLTSWYKPHEITRAASQVAIAEDDIYIGVGLDSLDRGRTARLTEANAIGRFGFVADLDVKEGGFATKDAALEFADALADQPSIVVDSGGGIQLWWVFAEPWLFKDDEKSIAIEIAQGFHAVLSQEAAKTGVRLDAVWDIPRLMRIPGGLNHKRSIAQEVRIVKLSAKIDGHLTQYRATKHVTPAREVRTIGDEKDDLDHFCRGHGNSTDWVPELSRTLDQQFEQVCTDWERTFNMTRRDARLRGKSASEYAFSLAGQAAWAGFPFSKILIALVEFYRHHGIQGKENRLDWFIQTIRKAAATNPAQGELAVVKLGAADAIEDAFHQETVGLSASKVVAKLMGVPDIDRFIQWGTDPAVFGVVIKGRKIEVGNAEDIFQQMKWRSRLYENNCWMPPMKPVDWNKVLHSLQEKGLWEPERMGSVGDKQLHLKHVVADTIVKNGMVITDRKDRVMADNKGLPYTMTRHDITSWWIPARVVKSLMTERDGKPPTQNQMALEMSRIGYTYDRRSTAAYGSGKYTSKTGYYFGPPLPTTDSDPRSIAHTYTGEDDDDDDDE